MSQWTPERIETLKTLWAKGLSGTRIANELGGTTRNAVLGKIDRLGLQRTKHRSKATVTGRPRTPHKPTVATKPCQAIPTGENLSTPPRPVPVEHTPHPIGIFAEPPPKPTGEPVDILGLSTRVCAYPIGDGLYCGKPVITGKKTPVELLRQTPCDLLDSQIFTQ